MAADVFVGLGTNLGDRPANLRAAGRALTESPDFASLCWSPVYETRPAGGPPGQENYFNAVVRVAASGGPQRTLGILMETERRLGRSQNRRWGPRVIDLDLLLYGRVVLDEPELTLPHPRMHLRRFVLVPLLDLAPEARHPVQGRSVREMLARLGDDRTVIRRVEFEPGLGPAKSTSPF